MVSEKLPEIQIIEETEAELEPLYRVIIHNDDTTPMEFVVYVLKNFFYLSNPGWIRRSLRCILWRQWKRPFARAKNLMKRGLGEEQAWISATNGRGPWWNSGASHMNEAFPKRFFDRLGLVSLLESVLQFQCNS